MDKPLQRTDEHCESKGVAVPLALHAQRSTRMDFYDRWVLSLYDLLLDRAQLVKKFGSLEAVDPKLISVELVHLFRGSKHRMYVSG